MVEYSGAVWEHMNQAWRVDDGVGCKTEMGLVTGMGKRTTGKGGKKGGQNLGGTRGRVGGKKEWKEREEFQGKDLEVQAVDVTRVVGDRAGALAALTN